MSTKSNWIGVVQGIFSGLFKLAAIVLSGLSNLAMSIAMFIEPGPGKDTNGTNTSGTGNTPGNGV